MKNSSQRKLAARPQQRAAYRTLDGWALGLLIEHGAVRECDHHGHLHDRSNPDARNRALAAAWHDLFPGTSHL